MNRWCTGCCALLMMLGCDDGGDSDAGVDAGPPIDGGGVDAGTAVDAGSDGGAGGVPLGGACRANADCDSGVCFDATSMLELGTGYCSLRCTDDASCTGFADDGYEYGCVTLGLQSSCVRRCPDGFGCQEGDFCAQNFGGNAEADLCLDLSDDLCTSDADCTGTNDLCTVLIDRERATQACFHGRAADGTLLPFKAPGEACTPLPETPCTVDGDCPSGFTCETRMADGRDVCTPEPGERCHLLCILPGVCSGLCEEDVDCPTGMRCSLGDWNYIGHTPGAFDDEPYVRVGFCTYAEGSGTSCTATSDCAGTGAGGADEACWPTPDSAGTWAPICVTPPAGPAGPGEVCGDDPTTDPVEHRPCAGACLVNRCAELCDGPSDCTEGACLRLFQTAVETQGFCLGRASCTADADCATGEVCNRAVGHDGAVVDFCAPAQGDLVGGDACEVDARAFVPVSERCDIGCVDTGRGRDEGRCQEFCATDADCPSADYVCSAVTFSLSSGGTFPDRTDDVEGTMTSCTHAPGSGASCAGDGDCATGEVCGVYFDSSGSLIRRCITEVTGGAELGEACSVDDPCRNPQRCIARWDDPTQSFCTGECAADADCPAGLVCRTPNIGPAAFDLPGCFPPDDPRGTPL